jgi:hypothetical protein
MNSKQALQAAIVALLAADERLTALIGPDKVFDEIPEDDRGNATAEPPYVYFGPIGSGRVETGGFPASAVTARLYGVSTAFGRVEAWDIVEAMHLALEGQEPELAAPFEIAAPLRFARDGDVIDPANPKAAFIDFTSTVVRTAL